MPARRHPRFPAMLASALLTGCTGVQSALGPAGEEARQVAILFWVMVAGGAVIWLLVIGTLLYALRGKRAVFGEEAAGRLIFWGGVAFPSTILLVLLAFALWLMPGLRPFSEAPDSSPVRIEVTGKQFWWQVAYRLPDGSSVVAANEVRLPVGQRVEFVLTSTDVIHSFWIPALGGKMDMIPGRTNRLSLLATKPGSFRGPCAEFCGTSHALMAFAAVAMEASAFADWLAARTRPSPGVGGPGEALFLMHGCGACHTVAGTDAEGRLGPDLSHLGSRLSLGAGILPNDVASIARFIAEPDLIKPDSAMPAFGMLPPGDIQAIAVWLKGLE